MDFPKTVCVVFCLCSLGIPGTHEVKDHIPVGKESTEALQNEWKDLATDLDSLFFWLCFVVLFVSSVVILGFMPLTSTEPSMEEDHLNMG